MWRAGFLAVAALCLPGLGTHIDGSSRASRGAVAAARGGDLPTMLARRKIRALVVYDRTQCFPDRGKARGFSYDLLESFEEDLNRRLPAGERVRVELVPVPRAAVLEALREGRGDLAAPGLPISPDPQRRIAFSRPTQPDRADVVVAEPDAPELKSLADLSGRDVVCRPGSPAAAALERINAGLRAAGRPPIRLRDAPESVADEDLIEMAGAGLIPAAVADRSTAELWKPALPGLTVYDELPVVRKPPVGWVLRASSPRLRQAVNDYLARHPFGSESRRRALVDYLRDTRPAAPVDGPTALRRFEQTIDYFRTFSERYALDYLLMAAQAYHESRLDQSARSRTGAIGVMQVRPETARDMDVGDVTEIGPNIHAGVKYLRGLVDRYRGEPMRPFDRAMFAFAAYNAGPSRVERLRAEAKARGFDPNVWFDNVEWIAAERIGRETASYVRNICKYWVAYRLLAAERREPTGGAPMSLLR